MAQDRTVILKIVEQCRKQTDLNDWEKKFLRSLKSRLESGQEITERQIEILSRIDER